MDSAKNMKCPVCGHTVFEQILVAPILWVKDGYMGDVNDGKAVDTYCCEECRYIMFFATDDPVTKRNWKYYHERGLG